MIWVVRCSVRGGPVRLVGSYRWRWRAGVAAALRRLAVSGRCLVTPQEEREWHPWRRRGRWVERRVLPPWFSREEDFHEQFREILRPSAATLGGRAERAAWTLATTPDGI